MPSTTTRKKWRKTGKQLELKDMIHDIGGKASVALGGVLVPAKHRVDRFGQLGAARFIDAARVDPKVLQAIRGSLRAAERELSIPRLALASVLLDVLKGDLLVIVTPGVRKDSIRGNIIH